MAIQTENVLHNLATAANDFLVASGAGVFVKKTLAEVKTILGFNTNVLIRPQGDPNVQSTGAVTITIANMLTGIVTGNPSAARAYTLDTGTNCDAGVTMAVNEAFDWCLININTTAANIITLTAAAGHTIVGSTKVPANSTTTGNLWGTSGALLRTRKTAANTFITYRIA